MTTYEKVCLKWKNFSEKLTDTSGLRDNSDFSDVTLVCEEDELIQAHMTILSACSPFFSSILKTIKLPHPIIYTIGLRAKDLVALMDLITTKKLLSTKIIWMDLLPLLENFNRKASSIAVTMNKNQRPNILSENVKTKLQLARKEIKHFQTSKTRLM